MASKMNMSTERVALLFEEISEHSARGAMLFSKLSKAFNDLKDSGMSTTSASAVGVSEHVVAVPGRKRRRSKKDPNAPKRPVSSFLLFAQQERPKIHMAHPQMTPKEVSKELGERWQTIDQEKKLEYMAQSQRLREEYDRRKQDYEASKGALGVGSVAHHAGLLSPDMAAAVSAAAATAIESVAIPVAPSLLSAPKHFEKDDSDTTSGSDDSSTDDEDLDEDLEGHKKKGSKRAKKHAK